MDFSDTERYAKKFDSAERDAWQRPADVIAALGLKAGDVVADIGSGTGYFEPWLSRAVGSSGRVLALDVEPRMVEHMQQRAQQEGLRNVESRLVAPNDPGLPIASVDRILIVNTWHHIDARIHYADKLARALRPSGELWIVDFTPESDLGPPPAHRVASAAVVEELAHAGLSAEVVEPESLPKQYLVRARPKPATAH
jgi:ubiquinone/menaquinone biosynthesis C-methylase UbiE